MDFDPWAEPVKTNADESLSIDKPVQTEHREPVSSHIPSIVEPSIPWHVESDPWSSNVQVRSDEQRNSLGWDTADTGEVSERAEPMDFEVSQNRVSLEHQAHVYEDPMIQENHFAQEVHPSNYGTDSSAAHDTLFANNYDTYQADTRADVLHVPAFTSDFSNPFGQPSAASDTRDGDGNGWYSAQDGNIEEQEAYHEPEAEQKNVSELNTPVQQAETENKANQSKPNLDSKPGFFSRWRTQSVDATQMDQEKPKAKEPALPATSSNTPQLSSSDSVGTVGRLFGKLLNKPTAEELEQIRLHELAEAERLQKIAIKEEKSRQLLERAKATSQPKPVEDDDWGVEQTQDVDVGPVASTSTNQTFDLPWSPQNHPLAQNEKASGKWGAVKLTRPGQAPAAKPVVKDDPWAVKSQFGSHIPLLPAPPRASPQIGTISAPPSRPASTAPEVKLDPVIPAFAALTPLQPIPVSIPIKPSRSPQPINPSTNLDPDLDLDLDSTPLSQLAGKTTSIPNLSAIPRAPHQKTSSLSISSSALSSAPPLLVPPPKPSITMKSTSTPSQPIPILAPPRTTKPMVLTHQKKADGSFFDAL